MNDVSKEEKLDPAKPILWIVIPCYNEKDVLPITAPMFLEQIQTMISKEKISAKSRILFVNDGFYLMLDSINQFAKLRKRNEEKNTISSDRE